MARITSVIACSHSPFLFQPLEWWDEVRKARPVSAHTRADSAEENAQKRHRVDAAFARLHDVFQAAKPDVVVIFGDDQKEQFDFRNFPAFAVYVGEAYEGYKTVGYHGTPGGGGRVVKPKIPEHWARVATNSAFAKSLLVGLFDAGFDPAFMMGLPNEEEGMGHAFMRPLGKITDDRFDVPVVPVLVNCFYAPQPSGARCAAVARALRRSIEAWPEDIRVAVVGSGGLWHIPGAPDAYIDEDFDEAMLNGVRTGNADAMATYFDNWKPKPEHEGLACYKSFSGGTGMRGGLGSGTGESRNWIMAAAVADRPGTVIDYVPVYASPCGMGFAYWDM